MTPCSRSSTPSSTSATARRRAPPASGSPGHGRPAVAVPVGLDHRAQLGRRGQASQHRRVVGHGRQVDLRPGRPRAPLRHGHLCVLVRRDRDHQPHRRALSHRRSPAAGSAPPPASTPPGSRGPRPPGAAGRPTTRPSGGPSDAARPCTWAAIAAASGAGSPRAKKAPMIPDRTSPLPAVARTGPPAALNSTSGVGPSRSAHRGQRPLHQDHRAGGVGQPARRRQAVLPGRSAGDPGVLPVVGREDARRAALLQQGARRGGVTQRARARRRRSRAGPVRRR